ncbi:MAG: PfkB domain protein [Myxococcales bacterium]|nr:PfkB domain protein [Myxococcales bacterium]
MATVVTFGELMLRLKTPGFLRLPQTTALEASFGGGEANVAVSLALFGHESRYVSAIPADPIGDWAIGELRRHGVETSRVLRQGDRLGIYFLEAGASQRGSNVVYDRAGSAMAAINPGEVDWQGAFAGARWFHVTGITPALSDSAAAASVEALKAAKAGGLTTSLDLNYRQKLWTTAKAGEVMATLMPFVDVAIANEEDCEKVFGIEAGRTVASGELQSQQYLDVAAQMTARFPNLKHVAVTLRESHNASHNGWSGLLVDRVGHSFSRRYDLVMVDRVGGGDSFAAGLIHALIGGMNRQMAIEYAVAASALKHSVSGDFNLVSLAEVEALVAGDGRGRVKR